ncbi:hypothetical protein EI94DRAFT_1697326 [Lactarius quietus]|nr:hypothetical protein EI94DRAFT_1697326 [Lactarius quietus]
MLAISTAVLFVLASSLAVFVQANGPRPQCTVTYTVPQDETCDSLSAKISADQSTILAMNSGISCDGTLPANQVLCVKSWQPTCTLNETATSTTCDGLASEWNITSSDFVDYNDNVNDDCTNLVVGQPIESSDGPSSVWRVKMN